MAGTYTIAAGDTLSGIAAKGGYNIKDILAANPTITNPDKIYAGSVLNLPGQPAPAPGTGTATNAPTAPAAPAAPAAPDYSGLATDAGTAGLSYGDYSKLFAPTDTETQAAQDKIAQQFGYQNYQDFITKAFTAPSQSTQDFYTNAYNAAGLDQLTNQISSKQQALNQALGTVNDNPWYDEAFRRGEASRLQNLANGDINTLQNEYKLKLGQVHDLVTQHASDLATEDKNRQAQLAYLEKAATDAANAAASARATQYLSQYASGKQSATPPKTVSIPSKGLTYQWNPATQTFEPLASGPGSGVNVTSGKGGTRVTPSPSGGSDTSSQKTLAAYTKALANRSTLNKAGTREQFIRQLQAQFPNINPDDIAASVYKAYPDGYNKTSQSATPNASLASANLNSIDYNIAPPSKPFFYKPSIQYVPPGKLDEGGVPIPSSILKVQPGALPKPKLI